MIKVGIMSFAHMHALGYAAAVNELDTATLTAVWDDDAKRGRAYAKQFETKFIADREKFLNSGLDAVIVTSENIKHREMVEAARLATETADLSTALLQAVGPTVARLVVANTDHPSPPDEPPPQAA